MRTLVTWGVQDINRKELYHHRAQESNKDPDWIAIETDSAHTATGPFIKPEGHRVQPIPKLTQWDKTVTQPQNHSNTINSSSNVTVKKNK